MAFRNLREDYSRLARYRERRSLRFALECLLFDNGFQAVILHRLAHWLKSSGVPALAPLVARTGLFLTGVDINPRASIGPGLVVSHGVGLVVGGSASIGARALLHQQVTIGAPTASRVGEMPTLGDDVVVGAGARIIGAVTVGDGAFVGASSLVTSDVPSGSKVTCRVALDVTTPGSRE